MSITRKGVVAALAALTMLAACGKGGDSGSSAGTQGELTFSILSAESEASMSTAWQPLIDDMQKATGLKVHAFYASNYTALIEAMRFGQVQVGWFSALPALEATRRANAEVIGRIIDSGGDAGYASVLIVRKGSHITLDDVLKCGKRLNYGAGDAESTSGTLAPQTYLFAPKNITPAECFKSVRSASHQANFFAVANGVLDVASNNTVGLVFYHRQNPAEADKVEVIWRSPPLPQSSILVRKDLDPTVKEKLRRFFLTYGTGQDAEGERQRQVLRGLTYGGFRPADDTYLDPVRLMQASVALAEAKRGGDRAKIAAAQSAFDKLSAQAALHGTTTP